MCKKMPLIIVLLVSLMLSGTTFAAGVDITNPGDRIKGVPNDGDWPGNEAPRFAIDDNIATKYLHFKGDFYPNPGTGGAGFRVTPSTSQTTVVGLTFTTANDVPGRDPIAFKLFGSNGTIDGPYNLIASSDIVDFNQKTEWPRYTKNETPISFNNRVAYNHYQLIFTAIRGPAGGEVNSMQIAEVELLKPGLIASDPSPSGGITYGGTWARLRWTKGATAASHDVYFGDNRVEVEAGRGDTYRDNQIETYFDVGLPGCPYPDGLIPGTTYYWRIDEVEANGRTKHRGDVWSFTTASQTAYNPYPTDGARFVDRNVILRWEAGFGAARHKVYFGDNLDDVNNGVGGTFQGSQQAVSFDVVRLYPDGLVPETTYYWRIDEVEADDVTVYRGTVWSFTTAVPGLGTILQEKWNNVYGEDLNALKYHWKYPDSPDETEVITRFDTGTNLGDNYGARIHGWLYAPLTGNYTFWICTDDQGELWLSTDEQPQNMELVAYVKDGPNAPTGWAPYNTWTKYTWQKSNPIRLIAGDKYYIMALWKEGLVNDHCQVAWEGPGIPERTIIQGEYFSIEPIGTYPIPADGARIGDRMPVLRWNPREAGVHYDVYFGTDFNRVQWANRWDTSGIYRGAWTEASYTTEELDIGQTYYWRIDDVEPDGLTTHKGNVWSFTIVDTITIEYQVSSSEDDGYASNENLQNVSGDYLKIGASSFTQPPYYMCGMVFRDVDIPQGAEIISAHLKIRSYNSRLTDLVYAKIEAETADSAEAFGSSRNMGTLPKTNASINWDYFESWAEDTWYESPNIAEVIQEVINRSGWSSASGSLAILYSTREHDGDYRNISSYDRGSDYAPKLEITYVP